MIERLDMTLVLAWLALVVAGLVMVTSATAAQPGGAEQYLARHGLFAAAALATVLVLLAVPMRTWEVFHLPCIVLAGVLCVLVLIPSLSIEVKGARRWIDIGIAGFQPAELAKLLTAIYLAGYVTRSGARLTRHWLALAKPLFAVAVLGALLLAQPDFGSTVVLLGLTGGLLFLGGTRLRDFAVLAVVGGIALALLATLKQYRLERITTFLDPWATPYDSGYQLIQALIGFGRGEFLGLGLGEGVQKLLYLPEAHNDFIYAVVAEELGLAGALGVLGLLGFLTVRMFRIGRRAVAEQRTFAGLVSYGAALLIGLQTVINTGVNTGLLPTKGLTLPFISFGGNSLVVCSALVALALRVDYEGRKGVQGAYSAERGEAPLQRGRYAAS